MTQVKITIFCDAENIEGDFLDNINELAGAAMTQVVDPANAIHTENVRVRVETRA